MRSCGIDVSGHAGRQQLCVLEDDGVGGLHATFPPPGTVEEVAAAVLAGGGPDAVAIDAPSGPRLDLLGPDAPRRAALGLPAGRHERSRVCDALLVRRRLPLYPVPSAAEGLAPWQAWMAVGFALFDALVPVLGRFEPVAAPRCEASLSPGATAYGRVCETFPDAVFCGLLGHRPAKKRTPEGRAARLGALRVHGVRDPDLGRRSLDELDACAAACAARGLATGEGTWLGDPAEGVIVLPVDPLKPSYRRP
jgi:hypothetical protein